MHLSANEQPEPDLRLTPDPTRVAELGEVFTPSWLVRGILDLVPEGELERIEATCLDPACGHGPSAHFGFDQEDIARFEQPEYLTGIACASSLLRQVSRIPLR